MHFYLCRSTNRNSQERRSIASGGRLGGKDQGTDRVELEPSIVECELIVPKKIYLGLEKFTGQSSADRTNI